MVDFGYTAKRSNFYLTNPIVSVKERVVVEIKLSPEMDSRRKKRRRMRNVGRMASGEQETKCYSLAIEEEWKKYGSRLVATLPGFYCNLSAVAKRSN